MIDNDLMPPKRPQPAALVGALAAARLRLKAAEPKSRAAPKGHVTVEQFFGRLKWLDGQPLLSVVEPYRLELFKRAFDEYEDRRRLWYNLVLSGRAKKNWKSADLVLGAVTALLANDSPGGNQCYLLANDEGQAGDDLMIAKKLIRANPKQLGDRLRVLKKTITRKDGGGFLEILPANDVVGQHGKTYRFVGFDEIHGYKDWDLFEAMQPDPTRADAQQWITSYASIFHRPGVPLYDLCLTGRTGKDPRMLFSWYAADFCTDTSLVERSPEERANPSMGGPLWDEGYLRQQEARLPAHKYRRLHLNLPGLPEGSAFSPERVMESVERGVRVREPEPGRRYAAWVDMSGGSNDDAVLCVGHLDEAKRAVVDLAMNQGPAPPFDPQLAVERFCGALDRYRVKTVAGDDYAGETFKSSFAALGVGWQRADATASELYEALETPLNGHRVVLLDAPLVEQQLLGLVWRGGKIDHPAGEHDDWCNAAAGVVYLLLKRLETFAPISGSFALGHSAKQVENLPPGLVRNPRGEVERYEDPRGAEPVQAAYQKTPHNVDDVRHRSGEDGGGGCRQCKVAWRSKP